jgi:hypothetical protein
VGFLLRMIQNSLETKGFLITILRRRTPSAPAPIFCFLAHNSRVWGLRGFWVSGGETEGLHFVGVLSFGDEFREDGALGVFKRNSGRLWRSAVATTSSEDGMPGRMVRSQEPKELQTSRGWATARY